MKKTNVFLLIITVLLASCKSQYAELGDGLFADIHTTKGDIIVKLEYELTPITVANFISLAEGKSPFVSEEYKNKKYYDNVIFHRVMKDFMIQGGDPTGTGSGNPGYKFKDELTDSLHHDKKGILSMANAGFETNGSQFFITHKATPFLDGYENGMLKPCQNPRVSCHTVFGEVIEGMDVVDSIANVKTGEGDRPIDTISMKTVQIIRNGRAAKNFDAIQVLSDYFEAEKAKIAAIEKLKTDMATEFEAQKEKAEELPSGLRIMTLQEGNGEKPKHGQQVGVHYAGYLSDGSLFDSNYEEIATKYGKYDESRKQQMLYEPSPMDYSPDASLIAGFKEGMMTMKVGDKIRLFIPPHLGYGPQGSRGVIPPNADLIFDLEITEIMD